jgi:hypothetical protein
MAVVVAPFETIKFVVDAVSATWRDVVVAFVVVAFTAVKFWSVVSPWTMRVDEA